MNIDFVAIRQAMWNKRFSMSRLARDIDISVASLSRKLSSKSEFTVSEAERLCRTLSLSPATVFLQAMSQICNEKNPKHIQRRTSNEQFTDLQERELRRIFNERTWRIYLKRSEQ